MKRYRYPWPASAITREEMAALHAVREATRPRIPISRLITSAIRTAYCRPAQDGQDVPGGGGHAAGKENTPTCAR